MRLYWVLSLLLACGWVIARPPTPPTQPEHGPGGSDYYSRGTIYTKYQDKNLTFWIVIPENPQPEKAPVAIFFPDADQTDFQSYKGWIEHLVRRGFVVVYLVFPHQQDESLSELMSMSSQSIKTVQDLLGQTVNMDIVWDLCIYIGHGTGGMIAYDFACTKEQDAALHPKGLLIVQPYQQIPGSRQKPLELASATSLTRDCSVLMITGSDDDIARDDDARMIFQTLASQLPRDRFQFITVRSDHHGNPPLIADHYFPLAKPGDRSKMRIDALDWLGLWKLTDRLTDSAFVGKPLNLTDEDLFLSKWSDGLPVNPMIWNKLP